MESAKKMNRINFQIYFFLILSVVLFLIGLVSLIYTTFIFHAEISQRIVVFICMMILSMASGRLLSRVETLAKMRNKDD